MKFSLVTISFNQVQFLERAMRSVLEQDWPDIEYVVVDPGSTDGSRELIAKYRPRIARVILEPDAGAADGLNKGFAATTGGLLGFLNSDDVLLPGALSQAAAFFAANPGTDVVSGDCEIVDEHGEVLRISHSDRFSLHRYAYGAGVLMQPSTFFRAAAYRRTAGFNTANRSNWDGELFVDMAEAGARFARSGKLWSQYRIHQTSITGTGKLDAAIAAYHERMFQRIVGRSRAPHDRWIGSGMRLLKYLENPQALRQRLLRGPVYRRMQAPAAASGR